MPSVTEFMLRLLGKAVSGYSRTFFTAGFIGGFVSAVPYIIKSVESNSVVDETEVSLRFSRGVLAGMLYPVTLPYFAMRNRKPYHSPSHIE